MNFTRYLLILFLANFYIIALCQQPEWLNYTVNTNPGSFAVSSSDIWTCSGGGILRINKETEEIINYNHANSFLSFNPREVFVDIDDKIWFYDSKNIGFFKDDIWETIELTDQLGNNYIRDVSVTNENRVYLMTVYNEFVYELINDSLHKVYSVDSFFRAFDMFHIESNSVGDLWIAGRGYFVLLSETDTLIYDMSNSPISDDYINDIYVDKNDNLWVLLEGYAETISVARFNGIDWTYWEETVFSEYFIDFNSIVEDENGILYMSSEDYRIFKFEDDTWEIFDEMSSSGLAVDSENSLWSLSQPYVKRKIESGWKSYDLAINELDDRGNYCISGTSNAVYIGGKNRITGFDGQDWEKFSGVEEVSLLAISGQGIAMACMDGSLKISSDMNYWQKLSHSNLPVFSYDFHKIFADSENEFWIGTDNGLFHFQNNELSQELTIRINDIDEDTNGDLWLASANGLIKYNNEIAHIYNKENSGLNSNFISHLSIGDNNEIWLSVHKKIDEYPFEYIESYLKKFENEVFEVYDTTCCGDWWAAFYEGFPIDKIVAGANNEVWINYKYQKRGLTHFKDEIFTLYSHTNSGLAHNSINDFFIDSDSNIFIIHDWAMSVFNKNGITLNVDEPIKKPKLFLYPNPSDGKFSIVFDNNINERIKVNIFDYSGRLVKSKFLEINSNKLDLKLQGLKSGIYFYHFQLKNSSYSGKFLVTEK